MAEGLLAGKVILITGASTGIGADAARVFAAEGAEVVLVARSRERLDALHDELTGAGARATVAVADVVSAEQLAAAVDLALARHGRLDGAFNNAGTTHYGALSSISEEEFDRVMAVNVKGVWLAMREEVRSMTGGGSIVNTTSVAGYRGSAGLGAYPASKHAVIGMTRVLARELGPRGIRVSSVAPGATETPIMSDWRERDPGAVAARIAAIPFGRSNRADEVAQAAAWLLSDRSLPITGVTLPIDGGSSA